MLILKLGGAAITEKETPNTAKPANIRAIAEVLARHQQPMILIHGAGSFGHVIAKDYDLAEGYQDEKQREALPQLQQNLHQLNTLVVDALNTAGLPAISIHPASMCRTEKGRIVEFWLPAVQSALEMGLLPVLYGDCVWDTAQGFSILSGDQLMIYLANALGIGRVAFGTNVDGVLDSTGQVIDELGDLAQFQAQSNASHDVTGGMFGKLTEIGHLHVDGAEAIIFNLTDINQLEALLHGQPIGTRIQFN